MGSKLKKAWFIITVVISIIFAVVAFKSPDKFIPMSDLLATIIAILIGVSLAISAVLASPPKIDEAIYASSEDRKRAQKILDENYISMLEAQKYLFWVYYISLMLAVCLKFVDIYFDGKANPALYNTIGFKVVATAFACVSSLALLWSATLPTLLHQVNIHKMKF
ncbi:MAG: hypothetical protein ABJ275_10970 [Maricaulaceae bacterium]